MTTATPRSIDEGFSPPPPRAAYFDAETDAWVLSRYADVLTAFRDRRLWPVSSRGEDQLSARDEHGNLKERGAVRGALSSSHLAGWDERMTSMADAALDDLPRDHPIELLGEFAKPWCMSVALMVTGTNPDDRAYLADLGDQIFAGNGEPQDSEPKLRAKAATAEMERYFEGSTMPMAQATFVGVSQTLPRLFVNGWLALFRNPSEVARLRAAPELMARAVEELMRYAGIIPSLFRKARADADLGVVRLTTGQRATLMIASANRDPERFPDPDRLDVSRHAAGELALGIGHTSCAGARLIRHANGVAIGAMLRAFDEVVVTESVPWRSGAGFIWPAAVYVGVQRRHLPRLDSHTKVPHPTRG